MAVVAGGADGAPPSREKEVGAREDSPEAAATPATKEVCGGREGSRDPMEAASFAPSALSAPNATPSRHVRDAEDHTPHRTGEDVRMCAAYADASANAAGDDAVRVHTHTPKDRRRRWRGVGGWGREEEEGGNRDDDDVRPRKTVHRPRELVDLVTDEAVIAAEVAPMHEMGGETYDEKLDDALSELESRSNMLGYQLLVGAPLLPGHQDRRNHWNVHDEAEGMGGGSSMEEVMLGDVRTPRDTSSRRHGFGASREDGMEARRGGVTADGGDSRMARSVRRAQALATRHVGACPIAQDESQEVIFRR